MNRTSSPTRFPSRPVAICFLSAAAALFTAPAARSADSAATTAVSILSYAEKSGDAEVAAKLADFFARRAKGPDRELMTALASRLRAGSWQQVLSDSRDTVQALGFSFTYRPQPSIVTGFAKSLLTGLTPATVAYRAALARQLADLFPKMPFFADLATDLEAVVASEKERVKLKTQGMTLIDSATKQLQALGERHAPRDFYEKRQQAVLSAAEVARRREETRRINQQKLKGHELVTRSYDFAPAAKQLEAIVTKYVKRVRDGEFRDAP